MSPDRFVRAVREIEQSPSWSDPIPRPGKLVLRNGKSIERVLFLERLEGVPCTDEIVLEPLPRGLGGVRIPIASVERVEESPFRLPTQLAEKAYRAGETGMGYYIFTLAFVDGSRLNYLCDGPHIDFPELPDGTTGSMICDLIPCSHEEPMPQPLFGGLADYYWCWISRETIQRPEVNR